MKVLSFKKIEKTAKNIRFTFFRKGTIIGADKIRKKPRTAMKSELLLSMAFDKMSRFKPYKRDNVIVLPYLS